MSVANFLTTSCWSSALLEDSVEVGIGYIMLSLSHCYDEHLIASQLVGAVRTDLTDLLGHLVKVGCARYLSRRSERR